MVLNKLLTPTTEALNSQTEELEPGLTHKGKEKEWNKIEAKQWRDRTDMELEGNWVGIHVREKRQETDSVTHTE